MMQKSDTSIYTQTAVPEQKQQALQDDRQRLRVDLYFGLEAPVGEEANRIQTVPGKGRFSLFCVSIVQPRRGTIRPGGLAR